MLRASDMSMPKASSAADTELPPGVLVTTMPRRVAASTSMLSTPVPALPITRNRGAAPISSSVTLVLLRTMRPS